MITIVSSGKLILSGEHAVVYKKPACAMATHEHITGQYQWQDAPVISLQCPLLDREESLPLHALFDIHAELKQRYDDFMQKKIRIYDVIQSPSEFCWFAMANLFVHCGQALTHGWRVHLSSSIPMGCGMGSSAALIVNLMRGVQQLFDLRCSQEVFLKSALEAENLQHGVSSGFDILMSLNGGVQLFYHGQLTPLIIKRLPFQYINTGQAESSTGECVSFVKEQYFPSSLWEAFEKVTLDFVHALKVEDFFLLRQAMKKNHQLLCDIGVVPKAIQQKVASIESQGGAAKICGAGSIRGDAAGMLLIFLES